MSVGPSPASEMYQELDCPLISSWISVENEQELVQNHSFRFIYLNAANATVGSGELSWVQHHMFHAVLLDYKPLHYSSPQQSPALQPM